MPSASARRSSSAATAASRSLWTSALRPHGPGCSSSSQRPAVGAEPASGSPSRSDAGAQRMRADTSGQASRRAGPSGWLVPQPHDRLAAPRGAGSPPARGARGSQHCSPRAGGARHPRGIHQSTARPRNQPCYSSDDARDGARRAPAARCAPPTCPSRSRGPGSCSCASTPAACAAPTCTCSTARSPIADLPLRARPPDRRVRDERRRPARRGPVAGWTCGDVRVLPRPAARTSASGALHRLRHRRRLRRVRRRRRALLLPAARTACPTTRPRRCCAPG